MVGGAGNRLSMSIFQKSSYAKPLAITLVAIALYAVAGFVVVPRVIERAVPDYIAKHLQRKATIGKVRFHPFIFKLDVRDFALAEADGTPIVSFRRLLLDFELSSIWRWAWTFSRIGLEGLDVNVDIRPDGKMNLALLVKTVLKNNGPDSGSNPGDGSPPRLVFQHISLTKAAITISNRSGVTPASATFKPINLELRDISTLPDGEGPLKVRAAMPGGGTLSWSGRTSLSPLASHGKISLKGIRPGAAWRFLRDETNLSEPKGTFDISAQYRFLRSARVLQFVLENLRLTAKDLEMMRRGDPSPILALNTIEASGGRFDLGAHEVTLPEIALRGGSAVVDVDESGEVNWQKLVRTGQPGSETTGRAEPAGRPWKIRLEAVRIADVALDYTDHSRSIPITVQNRSAEVSMEAQLETAATGLQASVRDLAITLSGVKLGEPGAEAPLVALDEIALTGGELDLAKARVGVKQVAVNGGEVRVVRNSAGKIRIVDVAAASKTAKVRRELEAALEHTRKEGPSWQFGLDRFEVDGVRIALKDEGFGTPISYDVENVKASVSNIQSDGNTPIAFDAELRVAQGGVAHAKGEIVALGQRATAAVKVERLDLKPLQPLVAAFSSTRLESGTFSTDARIAYQAGKNRPDLRVTGTMEIGGFRLNEASSGERLLAWKTLATKGISFTLEPIKLQLQEIRLVEPDAKVVVYKDRSLNLAKAIAPRASKGDGGSSVADRKPSSGTGPPGSRSAAGPEVAVEGVVVNKGQVDFADLSLVLPFAAKVEDLRGSVAGISSDPSSRTVVKLEGRVGEAGQAQVVGSLNPFSPKAFTDLDVTFRNVSMPPLSPYSVTFAGRKIASGQLTLDLRYKIGNGRLTGENKILLSHFTLGERVKAPGALDLPLDLAVALLTDADGRINMGVPVSGNVDDPQFSYGHLIGQALATSIQKIVTAPFRALGGLLGGGAESLDSISFDPGADALLPSERDKLKRVADALGKRPQLKLVLQGEYGEKDRDALREREIAAAVGSKIGVSVAAGEAPPPVNPADAKTQRALEALFVERNSGEALVQFATEFGKTRGKPVQRVNPLLAAMGKPSADVAFYEAMLKQLIESAPVSEAALLKLADDRAQAVAHHLVQGLSVPATRVGRKPASGKGSAQVKLSLDVAGTAAS